MWIPEQDEAFEFLTKYLKTPNLIKHCVATWAIMKELAIRLGEDPHLWGIVGLFHDLDLDMVKNDMKKHGPLCAQLLEKKGFPPNGIHAILAHNGDNCGVQPESKLDYCLLASETITGLIVATTLVYPSKKLADVKPKSVRKRMKEKRFAAGVDREKIALIEKVGIPVEQFISLSLDAMKKEADRLGL